MREQFNLNSIIALVVAFINILMFIIGTFLWSSLVKVQDSLSSIVANQVQLSVKMEHSQRFIDQMIPRGELELRLKAIEVRQLSAETDLTAVKAQILRMQRETKP